MNPDAASQLGSGRIEAASQNRRAPKALQGSIWKPWGSDYVVFTALGSPSAQNVWFLRGSAEGGAKMAPIWLVLAAAV